jgi:16S rRNA (uracil1498-N3)-methyltransferase
VKHRLYISPSLLRHPLDPGRRIELERERAHYLTRVLRLRRGAVIECFDGAGHAWSASLIEASPRSATLLIGDEVAAEAEPEPRLHLAQGLLKGAAMDLVVQKATELGGTDLWPILAERSNVPADTARQQRRLQHWQRVIESAAEQSGALHLLRLHPVQSLQAFLAAAPEASLVLLDPGAPPLPVALPRGPTCVLVGPEGGWSEGERRAAAEAGATRYGLGRRILRGETAPLAALAAVRHGWGWH